MTRRLAAILAADVAGYSRLMSRDENGTHARLKGHLAERFEPTLGRHGGRLVKLTGDGVLAEFASAVDAVSAAGELGKNAKLNRGHQRPRLAVGTHHPLQADGIDARAVRRRTHP